MSKLAFCETCNATYPLAIVASGGTKAPKDRALTCPLGHTTVRALAEAHEGEE